MNMHEYWCSLVNINEHKLILMNVNSVDDQWWSLVNINEHKWILMNN